MQLEFTGGIKINKSQIIKELKIQFTMPLEEWEVLAEDFLTNQYDPQWTFGNL